MLLRLFKKAYIDPMKSGSVRLLFEGQVDDKKSSQRFLDFYLYVWLSPEGILDSFQAVLDDNWVLIYNPPDLIKFGYIQRRPINRSVVFDDEDSGEHFWIRASLLEAECTHFPSLLDKIRDLTSGDLKGIQALDDDEMELFEKLLHEADGE